MPGHYKAFWFQRHNAERRGIKFKLTFEQWLDVWEGSGKLDQRGRKRGQYVMARLRDRGAYEICNVKIIRAEDNMREAITHKSKVQLAAWRAAAARGGYKNKGRPRPDLAAFNRSRQDYPLTPEHKQAIAAAMTGKKRGPYKTWKGVPRNV